MARLESCKRVVGLVGECSPTKPTPVLETSTDASDPLGVMDKSDARLRASLICKRMISMPQPRGNAFIVPLFGDYSAYRERLTAVAHPPTFGPAPYTE